MTWEQCICKWNWLYNTTWNKYKNVSLVTTFKCLPLQCPVFADVLPHQHLVATGTPLQFGSKVSLQGVGFLSHDNSNGKRCWIGRSMNPLPALNFAALTTPSRPVNKSSTTPMGHWFRFRSSDLIITTSTDKLFGLVLCLSWCPSLKSSKVFRGPTTPHCTFGSFQEFRTFPQVAVLEKMWLELR